VNDNDIRKKKLARENTNLHHVQIKGVRGILSGKSSLCVVHGEMGWIEEENGSGRKRGEEGRKKKEKKSEEEGIG
jgi:hypothetical protein